MKRKLQPSFEVVPWVSDTLDRIAVGVDDECNGHDADLWPREKVVCRVPDYERY